MKSTLMIFIDGVGIGKQDKEYNPFFKFGFKTFTEIFGEIPHLKKSRLKGMNAYLFPTDPLMGVPDIPLSGTGQTSIFCGINAPKLIGKHFGPYPYSTLIPYLENKSIFKEFLIRDMKVSFANAYPQIFFDYINSGRKRLSATSLSCLLAGVPLKNENDLAKGNALSAEIDNSRWVERLHYDLPVIQPETAAKRLLKIAVKNNFTLFEFFHTDHLGHGRIADWMERTITALDNFLLYILSNVPDDLNIVICSDHGNFEDLSIKMHTLNPALTITAGKDAHILSKKIKKLYHIKNAIMELYD